MLLIVILIGVSLRLHLLGDVFLWYDETEFFYNQVYGDQTISLRRFAASVAQQHTVGAGWPIILCLVCQAFGGSAMVARTPSVLLGTATIPAIFLLVYRIIKIPSRAHPFVPAFFAALLTAISIVQMEFSQRLYPYAAVPFLTTAIVIIHLEIVNLIGQDELSIGKFSILAFLYALINAFSLFLHMSFSIIVAGSFLILLVLGLRFLRLDCKNRLILLGISSLTTLALFVAWIGNAIHAQTGYRFYLAPYYHRLDFGAIVFLVTRAYDLLAYHLNLFYNGALYWPRQLNPVALPLVGICILGWYCAAAGKFGRMAKHLSLLAVICLLFPAILSLFKNFPFGGVRQSLFMSPFLFTFAALGFYTLTFSRIGKAIAGVMAGAYIVFWSINLPHFYQERVVPFTSQEFVSVWEQNGKLTVYADGGCRDALRYILRAHLDIEIEHSPVALPEPPFFLVSTHWAIEDSLWSPDLQQKIQKSGYRATLLMVRAPTYPVNPAYRQSLYHPPNGLWVYKITADEK